MTLSNLDSQGDILPHLATPGSGSGVTGSSDSSLTIVGTDAIINQAITPTWTGAHIWQNTDAGTTNVPVNMTTQHRSSGTPAAAFGVGIVMKLDSSAKTLRSAVELDAVWSTATDAAEVSSLALKTLLAGTATEVVRFGTGAVLPDADFSMSMGRGLVDSRTTDTVNLSHRDFTTTSNYQVQMNASGDTMLNCASARTVQLRHNNGTARVTVGTTGLGFFGSQAAQQTVGANVNNVASSGTTGQFDDFTNGTTYATDYAALHATVYQLTRSVTQITTALRACGLVA